MMNHDELKQQTRNLIQQITRIKKDLLEYSEAGGLPQTISSQLYRFMTTVELKIHEMRPPVEEMLTESKRHQDRHDFFGLHRDLVEEWDDMQMQAEKIKQNLEETLLVAIKFQEKLQNFIDWLSSAETTLANFRPISDDSVPLDDQIGQHEAFQADIQSQTNILSTLKDESVHITNHRQDATMIRNLLISTDHRLKIVREKCTERSQQLEARKNVSS